MNHDLTQLSIADLQSLIKDAEKAIAQKKETEKAEVLEDMKSLAQERGFEFSELMGAKKPRKKAEVKYRNPESLTQTWAGMGRKPKWLLEALEGGKTLEAFRV